MKKLNVILAITSLMGSTIPSAGPAVAQNSTGGVIVRIDDTSGSHCIDANTEQITVFLRRAFTEKNHSWFTQDNRAGVLVRSQLVANTGNADQATVQVPAVDMVSVQDDKPGRVSLALEYAVTSDFVLKQSSTSSAPSTLTKTIDLYMNLSKAKGKTTFGSVLDLAGQALNQLPIPPNPYTQAGSKFLKFANDAVDSSIKTDTNDEIAHIGLKFSDGVEPDLNKCESAGNERTGAIAAMRSVGLAGAQLIPVTNTEAQYCFRYSSGATYELLAAKRNSDGSCPAPQAFTGVPNDYVMLLLSAQPVHAGTKSVLTQSAARDEAIKRCRLQKIAGSACGV